MACNISRPVLALAEYYAKKMDDLKYYPENKSSDFALEDTVECSYIRGVFVVSEINEEYLTLKGILEDVQYKVSPEFLIKSNVNPKTMKVLYGQKNISR